MKGPVVLCCFIAGGALLAASIAEADAPPDSTSSVCCLLERGRTVDVRFSESLRPRGISGGQQVELEVANDVVVAGRVVLREGAEVIGHVQEIKRRQAAGIPARLDIVIDFARAVNGEMVPLSGVYSTRGADRHVEAAGIAIFWCICGLLIPGEDVLIGEGTIVTCFVRQDALLWMEEEPDAETDPCGADSRATDSPDTVWSDGRRD